MHFYNKTLQNLQDKELVKDSDRLLVVCGGPTDAQVLGEQGFHDALITNLDVLPGTYGPFEWACADAEQLAFPDESFDWVLVHAGLHHCASPHRGLLEMYRVARRGVLVIEARDSALIRLACLLGLTPDYECYSVAIDNYASGGLRGGPVPNYIYRWTEREVIKTIESAHPGHLNKIQFFYGLLIPLQRLAMSGWIARTAGKLLGALAVVAQRILPKQCNQFGFAILKTGERKPWMDGELMRRDYFQFDLSKYKR